ncbi:MAG TPA: hypothetical protein VFP34_02995, partial [Microlunatus sp.]|nr:hypothetical protein [Microlunatus sp.]
MPANDLDLPPRPDGLADAPVAVWAAPVVLPTYRPEAPDRYPAYLDRRVYQGSSGRVFPLPFHDRISVPSSSTSARRCGPSSRALLWTGVPMGPATQTWTLPSWRVASNRSA